MSKVKKLPSTFLYIPVQKVDVFPSSGSMVYARKLASAVSSTDTKEAPGRHREKNKSLRDISFTVESILIALRNFSLIFATDYLCQIPKRVWSSKQKRTLDIIWRRTLALLLMYFLPFPWYFTIIFFVSSSTGKQQYNWTTASKIQQANMVSSTNLSWCVTIKKKKPLKNSRQN